MIARDPKAGSFTATIVRDGIEASALLRGYASSARAAAALLNSKEGRE
jgi:hypothetical protein